MAGAYPATLDVDPAAPQNRLSVLLRPIFAIPHMIIVAILGAVAAVITLIAWVVILVTGKYPAGMTAFVTGTLRWTMRAQGYMFLLTDKYPPFSLDEDSAYPVRFSAQVQIEGRNRLTCFFRYIMAIPHFIVLYILLIVGYVVLVISWIAALVTGSVPPGMHSFLTGVLRWNGRVTAYIDLLTDEYPPFSLT